MALKNQVVSGFFWTAGEKFASLAVTTCAWLVLMGLIEPDSFGIWGMIAAFSVIANSIVDSGFSQALIQRQNPTKEDFSSVFWCNTAIAVFLYIVLTALSKQIASFYGHPVIAQLAPWVFLTFLLNALGIVQSTIFTKKMDFKPISKANFIASVTASAVALAMAFAGFGIWSLVANSLVIYGTRTLVLWLHSGWRPSAVFSARSVKQLFGLGSRLFGAALLTHIGNNFPLILLGKMYSSQQTGFYERSAKIKDSVANGISLSLQNVTFPAFSSIQQHDQKLKLSARQVVASMSFVLFPVMIGLASVAEDLFSLMWKDKWLPAVPYFQVLCLSAVFLPLSNTNLNILKAKGRGNTILLIEIIKKAFGFGIVFLGVRYSVMGVAVAYLIWMFFEMLINVGAARRVTRCTVAELARDTLPYLTMAAVMFFCVMGAGWLLKDASVLLVLAVKIIVGAASYILLSWLFKPAAWNEVLSMGRGLLNKLLRK